MHRRSFLLATSEALAFALMARTARRVALREQEPSQVPTADLEQRVARVLQAFDAQGNHRTATAVDNLSAEWLASEIRRVGITPALEPFPLNRVDPQLTYARIGNRRLEGVPMFDGGSTVIDGVSGRLGPFGCDAEIGLAKRPPETVGHIAEPDVIPRARQSHHKAVILITGANRPGLFLSNASSFLDPSGPPILQVSNVESAWLQQQAQVGATATVVAYVKRTPAQAFNVTATVPGRISDLPALVVMAPRSGWWQCVSEQGSRLVCWLEIMRTLSSTKPLRPCHFVALSGHELGFIGMAPYVERRKEMIKSAEAWIFIGSDIGQPGQPNLIHASDDQLEQWLVTALAKQGLPIDAKEQHSAKARGETAAIQRSGGRFVTFACGSPIFHSVTDRWPEAVDISLLARYSKAISEGTLELAQRAPSGQRS
jgi:hypothetical protein